MSLRKFFVATLACFLSFYGNGQVMNPSDPVIEYTGGTVAQPVYGQVGDWVKTTRLNWNTDDYNCYIYKGNIFRLKFPKTYQHNVADGKVYPVFIFFHGLGESGNENIYDNEYQLFHGGQRHKDSVNSGAFDGFLLYPQNQYGYFGPAQYDALAELIQNFLVPQNKADINRIYVNGLSAGGTGTWEFTIRYPTLVAAALPISSANSTFQSSVNTLKYIPIWHFQGGLDKNPDTSVSRALGNAILNAGGSYRYTKYPTRGHSCWNDAWSEPDFYKFMLRAHKANPVPLYGKYEFCAGETVNVTLGLSAGFTAYEWRKNGVVIPGATSNTYTVTSYGTYDCRFRRGTVWSPWSPSPIVVKQKDLTTTPDIQVRGLQSRVLPSPDGKTAVTLMLPNNYQTYSWVRSGSNAVLSTADSLVTSTPGSYIATVTEKFGCVSQPSPGFSVVNANGPNKPDKPVNVIVTPLALNEVKLDWSDNPNPDYNETNFEVYAATQAGGPYNLVGITGQDVTSRVVSGLQANTRYYFIIRAVNNTGASATTDEVTALTNGDNQAPSAPGNLRITSSSTNSVSLSWNASTDNIGVEWYDIFINGLKSYVTKSTSFTCYNLTSVTGGTAFVVKARDAAGNLSLPSNNVIGLISGSVPPPPAKPGNITVTPLSHKSIKLDWADNSTDETGFNIYRSLNPIAGFTLIGAVPANTTTYTDNAGLLPATTYYYQVSATYIYGGSDINAEPQASWRFNNNFTDASPSNKTLVNNGTTFNATDKQEGSHSLSFNGTNRSLTVNTAEGDYLRGAYEAKSVSFWMKSASNTGNRVIVDIGGSDDGISVRLNSNRLYANVASNNTRTEISTPYTSTGWNHIAVVYATNTFRLYVNGVLATSNTGLSFTSVGTTTNASAIGVTSGTNSANLSSTAFYNGLLDNFEVFDIALSATQIASLMTGQQSPAQGTTLATPPAPAAPSAVVATGLNHSSIQLNWSDNSTDETGFRIYKSDNNDQNFVLLTTVPANTTAYTDGGLFPTMVRYYKVAAYDVFGETYAAAGDSAKTTALVPEISPITNKVMRYDANLQLSLQATSPLNSPITYSFTNLPAFVSFTPGANGTGTLSFNPSLGDLGTYNNIVVIATDDFGSGAVSFNLVVNDNYSPVLAAISNVNINEMQTTQVALSVNDANPGDVINWSFSGLPAFATPVINGNSAQLNLTPGYADHGTYPVTVTVDDGNLGTASRSFNIQVNDVTPGRKLFINFTDGSIATPAPWNATAKQPALNDNFAALKDETGASTAIGMRILTPWGSLGNGSNVLGANTGNNSGIYPDAVIRSAYWTDANNQNMSFYGLDLNKKYTFTFFGSRGGVVDNRTTNYTMKGQTVTLNAAGNTQNTVTIPFLVPEADGTLGLTLSRGTGSSFGYLNALVIEEVFEDGSVPAKPRNLTAQLNGSTAQLNWIDAAYNETTYEVYRAVEVGGPYNLLNPGGNFINLQNYQNSGLAGNTQYFYTVRAINNIGSSPFSDTVSVTTGNAAPVMTVQTNLSMRIQETLSVPVTVTDEPGDAVTISATNLPAFATLVDNGNGTATLQFTPGTTQGIFSGIVIKATDSHGATATATVRMVVRGVFNNVYVNFSNTPTLVGESPWNNFNSVPFAGKALTNMIDDSETPTGISITQVDTWEGANNLGATTGNNTGVYPDAVLQTVYYQSSATPMSLRIAGLSGGSTRYNLVFFASRLAGDDRSTTYTANGQSVTLNAANNTSRTVQINGLQADANGQITFTCTKAGASPFAYLGALVIQSYVDDGTPFAPTNLMAQAVSKTQIRLNWSDMSSDETGFQVFRSTSLNGTYTLLATTAANVTTYTDAAGLSARTEYFYKVRGVRSAVFSAYTNVASVSTYNYTVSINFNRQNNAAAPWNNTARAPEEGRVFTGLRNELNNTSGLSMTVVNNFSGDNPSGMITGNNSGVWPDNVLRSSWWVDVGVVSTLKISNLNQNMYYTFVFSGSRNGGGDRTCIYTIGSKSVSLNASFNISQTVQIEDVRPDENGEVMIQVSLGQYSQFAYLNGMVINAYTRGNTAQGASTGRGVDDYIETDNAPVNVQQPTTTAPAAKASVVPAATTISQVSVYPNPFADDITVALSLEKEMDRISIRLTDASGHIVYNKDFSGLAKGEWRQQLRIPSEHLTAGVYILEIRGSDRSLPPRTFKLIKNR